jgi:hypothetical protein
MDGRPYMEGIFVPEIRPWKEDTFFKSHTSKYLFFHFPYISGVNFKMISNNTLVLSARTIKFLFL